jgi:very-short-patch-repair endonuclease
LIRKIHGHTGKKHSEESKAKMRMATAKRISEGKFPQTDTLPMREFEKILKELAVNGMFTKEFFCKYYSIDFAIVSKRLAFEVDGDF